MIDAIDAPPRIGLVLLAAGASSRMKEPKQLLAFDGRSMLRRAVETALSSVCSPVVVVLGANYERTRAEIEDLPVAINFNADWAKGLSSSIGTGLKSLLELDRATAGALFALADQPLVGAAHLDRFVEVFTATRSLVVAARYRETTGVPALFAAEIFDELAALSGDRGAKALIEKYRARLATIDLPEAALDIDTPDDYRDLTRREGL
jgi:molybdenum cofactor cytidylyltransferase